MKKYYNKLVRDNIPNIIEKSGKRANYKYCEDEDFYKMLLSEKIIEEAIELSEAIRNDDFDAVIEELVDIRDLWRTISDVYCILYEEMYYASDKKHEEKGVFDKKIFLESVEDIENVEEKKK